MRLGVDTYSYHRLLGEVRPGEEPARITWADPLGDVVAEARRIGADVLSLETSLLGPTSEVDPVLLAGAAEALEQVIAWGAPDGIRNGTDTEAFDDLVRWIGLAGVVGCRLVRIVLEDRRFAGNWSPAGWSTPRPRCSRRPLMSLSPWECGSRSRTTAT